MIDQPFRQTPLFQLNLLLWLCMPAKDDQFVPILHENGFEVYAIGASIRVPVEAQLRMNEPTGRAVIATSVSPDLLLQNRGQQTLLTIECKVNSFGPTSDVASQALGILACNGGYIANFIGFARPDQWKAWVSYAVAHPQQSLMLQTLVALSEQLRVAAIENCTATAFGIEIAGDGVYLGFLDPNLLPLAVGARQKVMSLGAGEDPRPLYLIPLDPTIDAQDEYGKRVVQERLRAAFASIVASRLALDSFVVTWEELLIEALQVWPLWKDQNARRNLLSQTKHYVRRILVEIGRLGVTAEPTPNGFAISGIGLPAAQQIRRYLMGVAYRQGELDLWQEGVQLGFEEMGDWNPTDSQG